MFSYFNFKKACYT